MKRNVALILAGGVGSRMKMSIPKQFALVGGMTVLQHTLMAFQSHQLISAIYVVAAPEWHDNITQQAKIAGVDKLGKCIPGGATSFESLSNGIWDLCENETEDTVVLVHDAVRPLVSHNIISRNIAVCLSRGNAITALASQESFMVMDKNDKENMCMASNGYIDRSAMLLAQTPHTFHLKDLKDMLNEALERGLCDAQSLYTLANDLGHTPLHAAEGELTNFKITHPTDILLFEAILHGIKG